MSEQVSSDTSSKIVHPVMDLLRKRIEGRQDDDSRETKLGLVIQGGGMRTVVTAGMVMALEDMGAHRCFDAFYGSSAGAFVGAYFVARQAHEGASILLDDLSSPDFIDWRRAIRRRGPFMALDHLCQEMATRRKPLDVRTVRESPFHIIATSASTSRAVRLTPFDTDDEVVQALHATCSLPVLCGPPVSYRDDRYFDGGIGESIPYRAAIDDGCTHILALVSTPWGGERRASAAVHHLLASLVRRRHGLVAEQIVGRIEGYRADLAQLAKLSARADDSRPAVFAAAPEGKLMKPFERRRDALRQGMLNGYNAVRDLLSDVPVDAYVNGLTCELLGARPG